MARDLENAKRDSFYKSDPLHVTLVWKDRDPRMGPHDLALSDYPDREELIAAYDERVNRGFTEAHVAGMLMRTDDGTMVGQTDPATVRLITVDDQEYKVIVSGRGRTLDLREANRRLEKDGLPVRLQLQYLVKKMSNQGAAIANTISNLHKTDVNPIDEAKYAKFLKESGMGRPDLMRALKRESWAAVENLLALLDLSPKLQGLVKERKLPQGAALDILKVSKDFKRQDELADQIGKQAAASEKGRVKARAARETAGIVKAKPIKMSEVATLAARVATPPAWMSPDFAEGMRTALALLLHETVPEHVAALIKAEKKIKPAVVSDPIAATMRDELIARKWPIRGLLAASHKRWGQEGKGLWPDEFCGKENWFPRIHSQITNGYAQHIKDAPKDSDPLTREEYFLKFLNTLKE